MKRHFLPIAMTLVMILMTLPVAAHGTPVENHEHSHSELQPIGAILLRALPCDSCGRGAYVKVSNGTMGCSRCGKQVMSYIYRCNYCGDTYGWHLSCGH